MGAHINQGETKANVQLKGQHLIQSTSLPNAIHVAIADGLRTMVIPMKDKVANYTW